MISTIHAAAAAIRQGTATPLDLVEQCLAAIECWEPRVHAWVFVDRDGARAHARILMDELRRGPSRGPLHGIPLGIKDIFDVADWPTAAGSQRWANSIARQDAPVVKSLREAGAIFLGKTVTTQFASFDPPVTRNPWNLARTPGGSSSGSAAAVATGMSFGALGSQTGGSITRPASYCGVAGCKPSYGLLPLDGIVPLAHSMDHPGPIARCVTDLALMLGQLPHLGGPTPDYERGLRETLPTPKLARFHGLFDELAEPAVRQAIDTACSTFRARGAGVPDLVPPAAFAAVVARHRVVMAVEAAQFHRARREQHPDDYGPNIRGLLDEGLACPAVEYADCKRHQQELTATMRRLCDDGVILITPATTSPAPDAATTGNPAFNSPWSYTGLPTISIPTGQFVDRLPIAIQFAAAREVDLFRAALWCEQALAVGPLAPPLPV